MKPKDSLNIAQWARKLKKKAQAKKTREVK